MVAMTKVWNIVSFLAVMNLIAVGCFLMWLYASGRIDADRLERTRTIFHVPTEQEARERVAAEEAEAIASEQAFEEASLVRLPAGSSQPIDSLEAIEMHLQRMERRFRSDLERDRNELLDFERRLAAREGQLETRLKAFEEARVERRSAEELVEFTRVTKLLEALPAKSSKEYLVLMCGDGQMQDAVDYLRAMRAGTRTSIFAAMKSEEEMQLASALLKSLRVPPSASDGATEIVDASSASPSDSN
jgi:hypothetical protein